jgi:predicted TIM-barrel fold metal-dependent hydrolase
MKIDIYTHIVPPKYKEAVGKITPHLWAQVGKTPTLHDLEHRFRVMDKHGDVKQVLTMAMTATLILEDPKWAVDFAQRANDEMAELVARYPDRFFAGVASLPMTGMDQTLQELERAITRLNLKGVQLNTSIMEKPLNLHELLPLFQKMAEYDLPIWIHPVRPIDRDDYEKYFMNHVFGWPYESTIVMNHLVLNGLFERLPGAKVLIHHCGALVPFFAARIEEAYNASSAIHGMKGMTRKPPIDYFRMFYTDTALSGNGSTAALMCGHAFFGADHILFGTDMPYDSEHGARNVGRIIEAVEQMGISEAEKKIIFEENARRLLGRDSGR